MPRAPPAWPRRDGAGAASAPTNRSPSGPPSRVGARLRRARVRPPSRPPLCGWTTGRHRAEAPRAARATAPEARGAARAARLHCAGASHPGPRARVRCSERGVAQSSAARSSSPRRHPRSCDPALTTRSPESAAPPSDPGLTGTPLPDPLRSDDQQLAPWPASATHGAPAYPLRDRTGIQAESFARNPYYTRVRKGVTPCRRVRRVDAMDAWARDRDSPTEFSLPFLSGNRHIVSSMGDQTAQPSGFHAAGPLGRHGAAVGNALRKTRAAWPGLSAYERFEEAVSLVLTALIGLVIIAAVINLTFSVLTLVLSGMLDPSEHGVFQAIFGMIFTVLIALLALARKFIILDATKTEPMTIVGLAAAVLALGAVYWFVRDQDRKEAAVAEAQMAPDRGAV